MAFRARRSKPAWDHPGQLELVFEFDLPVEVDHWDEEPDDWASAAPVHLVVSAAQRKPLRPKGPVSIFDAVAFLPKLVPSRRPQVCARDVAQRASKVIELPDGGIRHIAIRVQETREWQEREEARRARQVPPKAPKEMRGKGKKLAELVGSD